MTGRWLIRGALLVAMIGALAPAAAAQSTDSASAAPVFSSTGIDPIDAAPLAAPMTFPPPPTAWEKPGLQTALAVSFAALQALDVVTTLRGIRTGRASEANPLMGGLAQHPAALAGVKAGLAATTILSMRALSKTHPKAAAIAMLGLNAGSALVVRSNWRLVIGR